LKHTCDAVLAAAALVLAAPLLLIIATAIRLAMGRPILFRDRRAGFRSQPFDCLKFRTMTDARDDHGRRLPDDRRVTRWGQFLRATSLDELPQLVNILRGEMSLVGPRPLTLRYLDRYTPAQARRHDLRPGLTGWAQVNGRDRISWQRKFELDVWYVEHASFRLDAKILLMTVLQLLLPWRDHRITSRVDEDHTEEGKVFAGEGHGPPEPEFSGISTHQVAQSMCSDEASPSQSPCGAT
jgi:lipopolysaccharide/colanic/teichoic acid biosynthesis glycosyltransferase